MRRAGVIMLDVVGGLQNSNKEYHGYLNLLLGGHVQSPYDCLWKEEDHAIRGDVDRGGAHIEAVGVKAVATNKERVPRFADRFAAPNLHTQKHDIARNVNKHEKNRGPV